jgi:hypothetical protein
MAREIQERRRDIAASVAALSRCYDIAPAAASDAVAVHLLAYTENMRKINSCMQAGR